jgi:tRNA/rRNA methyltransferase
MREGLLSPVVVLVNPQMGENIGATARAMKNFGLDDLRLVAPRDGWPNLQAVAMASGADSILEKAQVFDTFAQAVSDCHRLYATTARSRDLRKQTFTPASAVQICLRDTDKTIRSCFVFGAERAGLDNDVIALCHGIIHIPTSPDFWSLNLAQSVLLVGYEWFQATHDTGKNPDALTNKSTQRRENHLNGEAEPASHQDMMGFFDHLESALDTKGFFFPPHKKPSMVRNLRTLFLQNPLTAQEIRTLRGVVRALSRDGEGE